MAREPPVVVWKPGDDPAGSLRAAAGAAGRADLAVVMPGVEPSGDWIALLAAAARCDTSIATASAMLSRGPFAPAPLDAEHLDDDATSVARRSARLRPRIASPLAGCVLVRRSAIDAAGMSDEPASPAAELADFAERCTALGLGHVLADDVLAAGEPAAPTGDEARALDARYPHRAAARALDARPESPIEHAVLVASRGLDKLSVTIDARSLGPARAGTQVHAIELVAALGRTGRVSLRAVTPPDLDDEVRAAFEQIEDLTLLPYERAANEPQAPTDIVHRPSQVFTPSDLALLLPLGHRIVVTHQDLIAYRIPSYHGSVEDWERYRRVTRDTLGGADHVVFFSEHARADALADALVDPATASVVPIGVDHRVAGGDREARRPPGLDGDQPFLLCLGADLRHKNHPFARALLAALANEGWDGRLVFAGPAGGAAAEAGGSPQGAGAVVLGPVGEDEKAWLLRNAAAVVYPTLYEGFGLIPFEAAAAQTPCLFAGSTALGDVLPASAVTLVPWDAAASARAVAPLLHDGAERAAHVGLLRHAADRYRWDDTAAKLVDLYDRVLVAAPRELRRAPRERLLVEERLEASERARALDWQRHLAFREEVGSDGLGLVGPGGVLAPADQRALLALLSRPALRRPATALARAAYALASKLQRRG